MYHFPPKKASRCRSVGLLALLFSWRVYFNLKEMKEKLLRLNLLAGLALLLASAILLALSVPFMERWFFTFSWWSLILAMDGLNFRLRRDSLLSRSVREFFLLAFFSVPFWCVFELFNLRLKNWSYHGLPAALPERWLGYFLSFATVLPALKELEIFWTGLLKRKRLALFPLKANRSLLIVFFVSGIFCLWLPVAWPDLFFPLVWLGFILVLEPVNFSCGHPSVLAEVEEGRWARFWSLVLSGFFAGILWEFLNHWAGSHWRYSLPYLDFLKVFEMPVLGFTGFLPFALEAFAAGSLFLALAGKWKKSPVIKTVCFPGVLLFNATVFFLIDLLTFKP